MLSVNRSTASGGRKTYRQTFSSWSRRRAGTATAPRRVAVSPIDDTPYGNPRGCGPGVEPETAPVSSARAPPRDGIAVVAFLHDAGARATAEQP